MGYTYTYSEIKRDLNKARSEGGKVILGRPDKNKGFEYYYLLLVPEHEVGNPQSNTIVMDCLNYNSEEGRMESSETAERFYKRVFDNEIIDYTEEDKQVENAMVQRLGRSANICSRHGLHTFGRPTIVPIIPAKKDILYGDKFPQELRPGIAKELAPQIEAMFEDARKQFEIVTGREASNQLIMFGHSSSASFGNNFSMLYPEKIAAMQLRWRRKLGTSN